MKIKKKLISVLIFVLVIEQMVMGAGLSYLIDSETKIKVGELTQDEVWHGKILMIGDVTVPFGKKLTIKPGTQIIFDERDILESGKHKDQCELIIYGTVEADVGLKDSIKMISVLGLDSQKILELDSVRVIRFSPYKIETEPLKKEFRDFKRRYLTVWGILYAMWIFGRNL
jgi:hypothetical protein